MLASHNTKALNLFEFGTATEQDHLALAHSLFHNTFFTSLVACGQKVSPQLLRLLMQVPLLNSHLREFAVSGIGLAGENLRELLGNMDGDSRTLSVAALDVSQNPLGDKGLEALSDIVGTLGYGLTSLNISSLGATKKGVTSFCACLRKNTNLPLTLTKLDLSYMHFEIEHTTSFCSWMASSNSLVSLNLSNTRIYVDKLAGNLLSVPSRLQAPEFFLSLVMPDAMLRGSVTNLATIDLSANKIKSLEKLSQFAKASQALQSLNLSDNPLQLDSLLDLARNIIANYALPDFDLQIRRVDLTAEMGIASFPFLLLSLLWSFSHCRSFPPLPFELSAERLLGVFSRNIRSLDMSYNQLGPQGIANVGSGLSANSCLTTLNVTGCFQMSKQEGPVPSETFAASLKHNQALRTLIMKGDDNSYLKDEVIPILEALASNVTLVTLDISGHQGGDRLATALGRLLQINSTLKALEMDDNAFSIAGFQLIRDGLMRNSTLQQMTLPVLNAMFMKKSGSDRGTSRMGSVQSVGTIQTIIKEMETKLSQNYSKPKLLTPKPSAHGDESLKYKFLVGGFLFVQFLKTGLTFKVLLNRTPPGKRNWTSLFSGFNLPERPFLRTKVRRFSCRMFVT